jgi:hypothetical protein
MTDKEALKRIAEKLRRAGASLPAPELTGTIEGSVVTGLCIALALVETEIEALAQEKALQSLHDENERLGLYEDAYAQPEPVALRDVIAVNLMREGINNKHRARELAEHFIKLIHPPQRTWVGLTDEEIDALHTSIKVRLMGTFDTKDIYLVVEQALKEKNT